MKNSEEHEQLVERLERIRYGTRKKRIKKKLINRVRKLNFNAITDHHFDKLGKPISLMSFLKLSNDDKYRRVNLDHLSNGLSVSTVWLGIDYSFSFGDKSPIIFETMVFNDSENDKLPESDVQLRYCTLTEAKEGHKRVVSQMRKLSTST